MRLKTIYSFLHSEINMVEKALEETVKGESPLLREASLHLLKAGGKRIRPVFVLLSGKFGKNNHQAVHDIAVALELIHMASLVHDDVIDDADLRRGKPTIKTIWDNRIAMYTGDFIFAKALELATNIKDPAAHKILSKTIVELSVGEIEQIKEKFWFDQNFRHYLRRIKRKTALLIAASCQLGAIAAGAEREIHRQLYQYGYFVGMSYQIIDDVLDFTSTEEKLGKPAGGDLRQGNITLPVLFAMENEEIRRQIVNVHENISQNELEAVIQLIKESGAIEKSLEISDKYLQKALRALEGLPDIKAKKTLREIALYIGKRKY